MKASKVLFFVLVLLLPVNLGKHFELFDSYVWGVLSDYLIPTLYAQDILVVSTLIFWLKERGFPSRQTLATFVSAKEAQFLILFIFSLMLSVASAARPLPAFFVFLRIFLYFLLFIYISYEIKVEKDFLVILTLLAISVIFIGALGILQFLKQGAVFNNYLFLGEQPYSYSTWGIVRKSVLGVGKIPAYSLFRHPNIFGGFLSVVLVWVLASFKKSKIFLLAFIFGTISLLLTFSYTAWAAFTFGVFGYIYISSGLRGDYLFRKKVVSFVFLAIILVAFLFPPAFSKSDQPSLYRRGNLYLSSLAVARQNPLFGVGPGNLVVFIDKFIPASSRDLRFTQPVHNIFLLIFAENGISALLLFFGLLVFAIKNLLNPSCFPLFLIALLQIIFLGSLDHYFWTIHQTSLLFWILLGLTFQKQVA